MTETFEREELIDGVLVAMSPSPSTNHNRVAFNIARQFASLLEGTTCEAFSDGLDLYLDEKNRFIPDMMVVCDPSKVHSNGVYGAPDLVVEVLSPSTATNDKGKKKDAYERAGVSEYWIVSPTDKFIDVFLLENGAFRYDRTYAQFPEWAAGETDTVIKFRHLEIPIASIFDRVP